MTAKIIDGKELAAKQNAEVAGKISKLGKKPVLAVILAGNNEASEIYVRNKQRAALSVGIETRLFRLSENVSEQEIKKTITDLNESVEVDGILLQLPLPKHLNGAEIITLIAPEKDVDGFTPYNAGLLALNSSKAVIAATPRGVLAMIKSVVNDLPGKHAVIIGRSNIVGRPLATLLLNNNCTVTITHSKTQNTKEIAKQADILVAACGCAKMVKADWVKPGAVVIDVGINRIDGKLCGDVDFDGVKEIASYISPVPGGVGPMTIASIWQNIYELCTRNGKL